MKKAVSDVGESLRVSSVALQSLFYTFEQAE